MKSIREPHGPINDGDLVISTWKASLTDLPHSLVMIILQNLDPRSLCRLEQTCRHYRQMLKQPLEFEDNDNNQENYTTRGSNHPSASLDSDELLLSSSSSSLSQLCWKPLFFQRFKVHSRPVPDNDRSFKALYIRRHQIECTTYDGLVRLNEQTEQTNLLYFATHVVTLGRDVMDLFWRVWTLPKPTTSSDTTKAISSSITLAYDKGEQSLLPEVAMLKNTSDDNLEKQRRFARSFLRLVQCSSNLEDIMECVLKWRQILEPQAQQLKLNGGASFNSTVGLPAIGLSPPMRQQDSPVVYLEEAMILVGRMFYDFEPDGTIFDTTSPLVTRALDELANQVRQTLNPVPAAVVVGMTTIATSSSRQIVEALHRVLFEQEGDREQQSESSSSCNNNSLETIRGQFEGNTQDYYLSDNSLLHCVLRKRRGLPLTLAILYQCIGHRLGLSVDIIGLPGKVVVYLPDLDRYVDVFDKGRMLTLDDCQRIVAEYGFAMIPSFLQALTPEKVLQRVFNNLETAFEMLERSLTTSTQLRRSIITTMRAILNRPDSMQLEECRHLMSLSWVSEHLSNQQVFWAIW
ncbi:hypothetical protein ACA910_016323 [Epithemia clementina (nom. ined.)]